VTAHRTLVLWDVDLTLVDFTGSGRDWYTVALAQAHGIDLVHMPRFPGRTELAITRELLRMHDHDTGEEHVRKVFAELIAAAQADATLAERGRALPGVDCLLAELAGRDDVVQSLVTGNLVELAECKLSPFGLEKHIEFDVGGYGSLSEHRHDLVADAIARAERKHGTEFPVDRVVVIGDTPRDVEGALHHGAVAIAVATGRSSAQELTDSGAHAVLPDLADTDLALRTLLVSNRP
jgi:phosphoglycolate phosphatase-like HAD superfamily hydrolase